MKKYFIVFFYCICDCRYWHRWGRVHAAATEDETRETGTCPPRWPRSARWVMTSENNLLQRVTKMKWNESGFRPPLCTYRLNWARRTSWGWWDDWDDTVLQTQDSKFEPWRSEAEHATSRSRRLPTILTFTRGWGRNIFCFFETAETGNRTPNSGVKGSGANHYPRAPAPNVWRSATVMANITFCMPQLRDQERSGTVEKLRTFCHC